MFEKPNVKDQVWKNQRGVHGLAKVKSWKLLESCGVHIIPFKTTQTYCCWYKLMLLDNDADSRLRLLEQTVAAST
nr:hypothetical protein [Tanacetum cinerariifolium]